MTGRSGSGTGWAGNRSGESGRWSARIVTARIAAAGIAMVLVLAGCSSGGGGGTEDGARAISIATDDPVTLNPLRQTIAFDQTMVLFAPLTSMDKDNKLQYVAAESVESDDATTWTIKLRKGWTFQNGEKVTADSYIKAWNYEAYGPHAWENSGQLANIVGYDRLNPAKGKPKTDELSGLKKVDALTFTVKLQSPDGQFPVQLSQAQTGFFPLPAAAYDDLDAFAHKPIGNGPFEMQGSYQENQPITMKAWSGYQGPKPTVDKITFKPYTDMTTAYTDVQAGSTDIVFVPASRMNQVMTDFGDRAHVFQGLGMNYLGLPLWDKRFADKRVREAISMAIDRQAVSKAIYGGIWEPATALTPPGEPGTPKGLCGELCEFHPDKAKQRLAEAGGWTGKMEIVYPGGAGLDDLYNAYANQLRQNLGIKDVVATPTTDFPEFQGRRNSRDLNGPYFARWGALYASQQNTLRSFYLKSGGCVNCIPYYSDDVAAAIAKADAELDRAQAIKDYVAVQKMIMKEFPAPPMFFEKYTYATSTRVTGLVEAGGNIDLTQTQIGDS
ncbi:peptide ABC transporter substrate-binding protein [Microlunatus soli]|uniref:Oligopeptide transport system substrate-binding protein n=1 Tax=Microlunatus soli TaxID=630515 RepID=A0A1H1NY33_9ACTN|nr:ABC transporter substrate-binding protein [Microlunatus soli]SDS03852.1 oligopeptide transport system substrate-binding protein [Microlunatus soli]